jgi:hypothetical protein
MLDTIMRSNMKLADQKIGKEALRAKDVSEHQDEFEPDVDNSIIVSYILFIWQKTTLQQKQANTVAREIAPPRRTTRRPQPQVNHYSILGIAGQTAQVTKTERPREDIASRLKTAAAAAEQAMLSMYSV